MKKQMKRTVYEAPVTELFRVELEGNFMAGSADVKNPNADNGRIEEHQVETGFTGGDFSNTGWDAEPAN